MAFTGVAVITPISDRKARITGLSLAFGATGTISLAEGAGAVLLPATFQARPYSRPDNTDASLIECIEVRTNPASDVSDFAIPIRVTKTGTTAADFLITLENDAAATNSPDLEIWVEWH